jgi:UDP-3-O-[3-hydroxymyristoyl] glucosamine N-acyltransferase
MQQNDQINLSTIVELLNGELLMAGNTNTDEIIISGINNLDKARPKDLSFLVSPKYFTKASNSQACLILAPKKLKPALPEKSFLLVDNVWSAINALLPLFYPSRNRLYSVHQTSVMGRNVSLGENVGIGPMTVIADNAVIGDNCFIDAQCYIGENVVIETNSILYPGVKLLMDTTIGKNCIIHAGAVLGADGFRFEVIDGIPTKVSQVGNVVIGDNVEIGANTCIDRAFIGSTTIGNYTKIDNLVQIGHNCEIGPYNGMAGQVGIAGSVKTGAGVMFWGQAGIVDNISIAEHTTVGVKSLVISNIDKPGGRVLGLPAIEHKQYLKMIAALKKLPFLIKNLKK